MIGVSANLIDIKIKGFTVAEHSILQFSENNFSTELANDIPTGLEKEKQCENSLGKQIGRKMKKAHV